jgi:hypothetical protein
MVGEADPTRVSDGQSEQDILGARDEGSNDRPLDPRSRVLIIGNAHRAPPHDVMESCPDGFYSCAFAEPDGAGSMTRRLQEEKRGSSPPDSCSSQREKPSTYLCLMYQGGPPPLTEGDKTAVGEMVPLKVQISNL